MIVKIEKIRTYALAVIMARSRIVPGYKCLMSTRILLDENDQNVTQYCGPTVITVARAITLTAPPNYKATVFVDGLPKSRTRRFATQLRQLGVRTEKVRGVRKEETTTLVRLADALCGFVRGALAGHAPLPALLTNAKSAGVVQEL